MKFRSIAPAVKMLCLLTVIGLASCKKDSSASTSDTKAATLSDSSTVADNMYNDVLNNAFYASVDNESVWNAAGSRSGKTAINSTSSNTTTTANLGCAIYSFDDSVQGEYPKVLTVNFGTGCTSTDGVYRSGVITFTFSGPLLFPGTTTTATFNKYVVNGYGIQGAYSIANNSTDVGGIIFTTQVTNGIITYPDASNYNYASNKTFSQTGGLSTFGDITDDVYSITGNSSFASSDGSSLVCTVTTPLVKAFTCPNISAGVLSFVYDEAIKGTIDFGDGTCDSLATLKVGSIQRMISLR